LTVFRSFAVWDVCREDEFSPLKNATGAKDTPDTCRIDLLAQHKRYVQQAGAILPYGDFLLFDFFSSEKSVCL